MSTHKDEKNGTWYVTVRYHDWKGTKRQKCKRGFATRREAQEWERNFRLQTEGDPDKPSWSCMRMTCGPV